MTSPSTDGVDPAATPRATRRATPERRGRAQSETVGIVLLTAVVVIVVAVGGAFVLSNYVSESPPNLAIEGEATSQNVTIWHSSGDSIDVADLEVILRGENTERYGMETFTQERGTDETRFQPGDKFYRSHGIEGDRVNILVVHGPSNEVIDEIEIDVVETLAARFEYTPSNPTSLDDVTFDGSDSISRESTIEHYDWKFGDGTATTGETAVHSYDDPGTYDVNLTVETKDGRTATRTKSIEVYNPSPDATFDYEPTSTGTDDQITFDASASTSPDGEIQEYRWDFDDETTRTTENETVEHSYDEFGTFTVALTVEDDQGETARTTESVAVEPALFSVTITDTTSPVPVGDELSVTASIENTGGNTDTQSIELTDFDGSVVNTTTVTLDGGERQQTTLTWDTTGVPPGTGDVTVSSANDSDAATVEISQFFRDVTASDVLVDKKADQTFSFELGTDLPDGETVTIDLSDTGEAIGYSKSDNKYTVSSGTGTVSVGSESGNTVLSLVYESAGDTAGDVITVTATDVDSETANFNDEFDVEFVHDATAASETASFIALPDLQVTAIEALDDDVVEGEPLDVEVTVRNNADRTENEVVSLGADPEQDGTFETADTTDVTVAPDTAETVVLTYNSAAGDARDVDLLATTEDDDVGESATASLDKLPYFDVEIVDTNSPVQGAEELDVNVTVTNEGDITDTQSIRLWDYYGDPRDSNEVTLAGGESEAFTLTWQTSLNESGAGDISVTSANETETEEVTVQDYWFGDITITETNAPISEGETLAVTAAIGEGVNADAEDVVLTIDGEQVGSTSFEGQDEVTLEWETDRDDTGNYTATMTLYGSESGRENPSEIASDQEQVEVLPPEFTVSTLTAPDNVVAGEEITVKAEVTNDGLVGDDQQTELRFGSDLGGKPGEDYDVLDTDSVSLDSGESTEVRFENVTVPEDVTPGETLQIGVFTDRDSTSQPLEIREPSFTDLSANVTRAPGNSGVNDFLVSGDVDAVDDGGEIRFRLYGDDGQELTGSGRTESMSGSFTYEFDGENNDNIAITVELIGDGGSYESCESATELTADNDLVFEDFECS